MVFFWIEDTIEHLAIKTFDGRFFVESRRVDGYVKTNFVDALPSSYVQQVEDKAEFRRLANEAAFELLRERGARGTA